MDAVDAIERVHPVGEFAELASFFQTDEVHQRVPAGALVGLLSPSVLQRLKRVLTHGPAQLPGVPIGVVEEATDSGRRFDRRPFRQGSAGTIQHQIVENLERFSVLLASKAGQDVRIKSSGTLFFWIHTPIWGQKYVPDILL
ncbi:hypothetical protein DESA109040_18265 [Deinococcus saxicola]